MLMLSIHTELQGINTSGGPNIDNTGKKAKSNQTLTGGLNGNNKIWANAPIKTYLDRKKKEVMARRHLN